MNIKIKEKRGITLISLVVTIILLLILAGISIAMLTGENGIFKTAQKAKLESQKADYRETIELSKVEEGINKKLNRTKKEKLEGIYNILRNGEKFKKDVDSSKASMELIDNDELEPRIVIKTKEGWKYTVTVDGIIEGEIPPIDLEKADIKIEIEPTGWTNEDVEVVSIKVQNEEYKENKIQYSYNLKAWRDYKDTEKIKITENKKIYARLANGLSISDKYATGNVINIDKKETEISTAMNSSNVTTKGFTVNVGVKDENSGLGKIVWYYKKSDATSYTSEEEIYKDLHSVQSGETTAVTKSKTYDNLTSGTYNVYAEIYDVAGNITNANSSDKSLEITLGKVTGLTTANTTFTANPTEWTNEKVTMTASTNVSGYTIQTSKDAQTWSSTASQEFTENGKIYARLWDGTNAGGYSTGNVTNIDTLAPKGFTPTATSTTKSITVTVSATDADATETSGNSGIDGYRFKLDSGSWSVYQASGTYKWDNLTQTTNHTITVEVKDNAGNTKQGTASKGTGTVAGLTTANTTFTASPTGWTNGKVTMTASTNVSGYTIQTTKTPTVESSWKSTASQEFTENGKIYARLWDGTNAGGYSTGNVTNIDTLAPKDFTPTATSTTKSITVTASATDADATLISASSGIAGYRFKLDSGSWSVYQTSGTYKWDNLAQTTNHTITVEAKDNAGNTKQGTVSKGTGTVAGLTTANTTFKANPDTWTNGKVTMTASTNVSGYTIQTTKTPTVESSWKSTASQEFTENGKIYARLWDGTNAGGYSTGNVTNIDTLAPKDFTPIATSTTKSITVTANTTDADATSTSGSSGIAGYRFKLDSGSWTEYQASGTYKWDDLAQTTNHTITVEAKDNAGNTKQGTVSKGTGTVAGLTTANTTFKANPTGWTNEKVTMTVSTNVSGYTIQTSKDAQTWSSTASQEFTENGKIYARLWDGTNAGGYSTGNVTNIDTLAPKDFTPIATSTTKSITVTANTTDADATSTSASSGIAGYRFKLDSGSWTEYQASGTYKWDNLTQTTNHTITVEAKDNAGNTKQATVSKGTGTVTPGTTTGAISFSTPTWSGGKASTTISTNTGYTIQYQVNSTTGNWTTGTNVTGRSHGDIIYARLTDGTNAGTYASLIIRDEEEPTLTFTSGEITSSRTCTLTVSASDSKSGLANYKIYVNGDVVSTNSNYTITDMVFNQTYTCYAIATDNAGNSKQSSTITLKNEVYIATLTDLSNFRDSVNGGNSYSGKTVIQTSDIDMASVNWVNAIGIDAHRFAGTYNGNGRYIVNLKITASGSESGYIGDKGLFGNTEPSSIIENLIISNANIQTSYSTSCGIICGFSRGTIRNIRILSGNISGTTYIGGVCGSAWSGNISSCTNSASVVYSNGLTQNTGWQIGGIAGIGGRYHNETHVTIENCINTGTVSGTHAVGGIIGELEGNTSSPSYITGCVNKGTIISSLSNISTSEAGGIAGCLAYYTGTAKIINCYNTGTINATSDKGRAGGIVAFGCGSGGNLYIQNCYNIGTLNGSLAKGGIIGKINANGTYSLSNNYWLSGCGATYGIVSHSSNSNAVLQTATQLKGLTGTLGSAFKNDSSNINGGYPILSWQ